MAQELNKHLIDVNPYDGLVVGGNDTHQCGVTVKAGQDLKRGTILATDEDDKAVIFGTASEPADEEEEAVVYAPKYILAQDINTADGDDVAIAYDRATIIKGDVIVAEGYTLTAEDIDELRKRNIFFEDKV